MDEIADIEGTEDDGLHALARLLQTPAPPSTRRRRIAIVPIRASDAEAAGGEEIVHRTISAVASPDDPQLRGKAADVIAALAAMKPSGPMESSLAGLFVAMERAALDSLAVARIAGFDTVLGVTLLGRAERLTARATELAEVIAYRGARGNRRKIVIQHIHEAH